jgi:hypothetical protein
MKNLKTTLAAFSCAALLSSVAGQALAANWLMLQGTERDSAAPRAKLWGFIQTQYQKDYSDPGPTPGGGDGYVPPKLIGPNLDDQDGFNVNRARIGVRGQGFPLDGKVNYFILAELGNNGITYGSDGKILSDASITLNYIKGARIRMGLFKYPGAEEGLQAIHVFDYVNFTQVSNQMLLERFSTSNDTNHVPPSDVPNADMNAYSRSVGAFRDVGVQVFDSFKSGNWDTSYALMYGNGNGLNYADNDSNKDTYVYLSTERAYGGKGPFLQSLKFWVWGQSGKRTNPYDTSQEFDRTRSGIGVKYFKKPFRITAEYMSGKGVIFQGQHRATMQYNDEKADGYYLDLGWYIPHSNWEIDLRYDKYTRGEHLTQGPNYNPGTVLSSANDESRFETVTIGTQYHFNKKTKLQIEYADRSFESDTPQVNAQLKDVKGRLAVQVTHIF